MGKRTDAPCYGCGERKAGCHAACEKYQRYAEARRAYNQERMMENILLSPSPALEKTLRQKTLAGKRGRKHGGD